MALTGSTELYLKFLRSPEFGSATILIAEGEYNETVNVTRKGPLTMLVRFIPSHPSSAQSARSMSNTYHVT